MQGVCFAWRRFGSRRNVGSLGLEGELVKKNISSRAQWRRHKSWTVYITALVGMGAWFSSRPAGPAVPMVTFGTAADTPAPSDSVTPTAHRTGFVLTTATTGQR